MAKYEPEPFKIKATEPIRLITREEREKVLQKAYFNTLNMASSDIFIDLLTDSGNSSMTDRQWSGLMMGDESYTGSRSFFRLEEVVQSLTGYKHVLPVHQGRAAENVVFPLLIKKGQVVIGNTNFTTSKAHIQINQGISLDFISSDSLNISVEKDFKGNLDTDQLLTYLKENGSQNVAFIMITITNNNIGGLPVSMQNIKEVSKIAKEHGILLVFDAARFAENAYYIHEREDSFKEKNLKQIILEMFSFGDVVLMSGKKDAAVNIGGLIVVKDKVDLYESAKYAMIPIEGFPQYGGLAGRDMEAFAIGLEESTRYEFLQQRIKQVENLGKQLIAAGIPIQKPIGGHAIYLDAKKILPHIPPCEFPALALCIHLYLESGIRGSEMGSFSYGRGPNGEDGISPCEFLRLCIPRRVYTDNHMRYVADNVIKVCEKRQEIKGLKLIFETKYLRDATSKLEFKLSGYYMNKYARNSSLENFLNKYPYLFRRNMQACPRNLPPEWNLVETLKGNCYAYKSLLPEQRFPKGAADVCQTINGKLASFHLDQEGGTQVMNDAVAKKHLLSSWISNDIPSYLFFIDLKKESDGTNVWSNGDEFIPADGNVKDMEKTSGKEAKDYLPNSSERISSMYYGTSKEFEKIHNVICQIQAINDNKSLINSDSLKNNQTIATKQAKPNGVENAGNNVKKLIESKLVDIHSEL
ncbi:DgyrCDS2937 [Dimorphilus gyrociliatus]|uniref:DgyrCDS2937 n=1 Tax=Dimorphilus gyrociliatus TaxID=2664684 RepID=A0A7I8VBV8_9ANNE|nr:DgyrCDS2937 [Dimorphilus gyrociliatus]